MASSLTTASPASASGVAKLTNSLPTYAKQSLSRLSFRLPPKPKLRLSSKGLQTSRNHATVFKAQLKEVAADGSSTPPPNSSTKPEAQAPKSSDPKPSNAPSPARTATEDSIRAFMNQVSSLIKLVDSRDIVELELKQFDCELVIRKKEALAPPSPSPVVMMQQPPTQAAMPPSAAPAALPAPAASPVPTPTPSTPAAQPAKSSAPAFKSPMAGTFYQSPGPGEPPFVKVGDKVQKGQVLCIVEAMKLMNEIEADQSGTIAEILADDGKPVSVDTPLFVLQP